MVYRDMTFCVNEECKNRCSKYLTCENCDTVHSLSQYMEILD